MSGVAPPLTAPQESVFLRYYAQQLAVLNHDVLALPTLTHATAQAYFRRFHAAQPLYACHPKFTILVALFVACKVEEHRIDAATLARKAGKPAWEADILAREVALLQALDFRLRVDSPHAALLGWMDELRPACDVASAEAVLRRLLTTEALAVHGASLVALACVIRCDSSVAAAALERFDEERRSTARDALQALAALEAESGTPIASKDAAPLEKALTAWMKANKKLLKKMDASKKPKKAKEEEAAASAAVKGEKREMAEPPLDDGPPAEFEIRTNIHKRARVDDQDAKPT